MGVQINQLSAVDVLSDADLFALWSSSNGDTRKVSASVLYAYIQSKLTAAQASILSKGGAAVAAGVDTTEDILLDKVITAGSMGPTGMIRGSALLSFTNNANAKTVRVRLGGVAGTILFNSGALTNLAGVQIDFEFWNRSLQNSQIAKGKGVTTGNLIVGAAQLPAAVDTSVDQHLVITGQKATAGDTCTLEASLLELIPGT